MDFYKNIKIVSGIIVVLLVIILIYVGDYFNNSCNLNADIRNLILAVVVSMFFAFLLSIQSIREYLLKSVSNFMTDNSYLAKLNDGELIKLKKALMNRIHGTDIVSNKESLFNHLERLDSFHSIPHRSIVNESWIFENATINDKEMFLLNRTLTFRIHSLDIEQHKAYKFIIKSIIHCTEDMLDEIKKSIKIEVTIDSELEATINGIPKEDNVAKKYTFNTSYEKESSLFYIDFEYEVELKQEFTPIRATITRLEEKSYSQAIFSKHATYGLNYNITLPDNYKFDDIYNNDTLDLEHKNITHSKNKNQLSVNVNGWQLPGLIFVYTYSLAANHDCDTCTLKNGKS